MENRRGQRLTLCTYLTSELFAYTDRKFDYVSRFTERKKPVCGRVFLDETWRIRVSTVGRTQPVSFESANNSNRVGHRVRYLPSAGGICDCGDAEAWNPKGFVTSIVA